LTHLFPDSLAARTIAVLLVGLGLFHLGSIWVYQIGLETGAGSLRDRQLAESMISIARAIGAAAADERDRTAHSLSSPNLEVHWSRSSVIEGTMVEDEVMRLMRHRLSDLAPEFVDDRIRLSRARPDVLLAAIQVPDGSWVDFSAASRGAEHGVVFSTTAMAVGILLISVILVRGFTAPLRRMAGAADRIGRDVEGPPLVESGPREVREATRAFNEMKARIQRLIEDRTHMLAAVSHDLKTPITRLRLRVEFVEVEEERAKMSRDLDEMEIMIDQALSFLRGDGRDEEWKLADLSAMLEAIASDLADTGRPIHLTAPAEAVVRCRPLALKRALINLIDNALKYGATARVRLSESPTHFTVEIEDDGPGIPEEEREAVFDPFYRREASRSRDTGGAGLGLTIARTVVRAIGGNVTLGEAESGGLRVEVTVPLSSQESLRTLHPDDWY
jgi:signal transduction histidine kinase